MIKVKKRGISPLIATVLLIGFVVAIVLLVFLWGKNYIEELAAKRGLIAQKEQECQLVSIDARSACRFGTKAIMVLENKADKQIDKFVFRGIIDNEAEVVESFTKLGAIELNQYDVDFSKGGIQKVEVIPALKAGRNKYVPCTSRSLTVRLNVC